MSDKIKNNIKTYDLFIPFGRSCHCAMHLDIFKLRTISSPFDWLIPSDLSIEPIKERFDLLNNFSDFFNYSDFEFVTNWISNTNHYMAINNKYKFRLAHDFEINLSNRKNFEKTKEKYLKRYNRLIENIKKSNKICFVYMVNTWIQMDATSILDIEILKEELLKLNKIYPNKVFDFIIFEHSQIMEKGEVKEIVINKNIIKYLSNHSYLELSDEQWQKNGRKMPNISPTITIKKVFENYKLNSNLNTYCK